MFIVFSILAILSLLLAIWQWGVTWRFPLHQRIVNPRFSPAVSLLKPLKGFDEHTGACLRSWFNQTYSGQVQILFGVASETDPVCELVRQLIREHPKADAELVICRETLGVNAKVSSLIQIARCARHEHIVVSDADVLVSSDFLANAIAPLSDKEVGLVNCFYRLANPENVAMRWEAIAINADFWSQVLQGKSLAPLDFALGAVMLSRREQLKAIGGFEALADYLADDFQLGNRVSRIACKRIALSPVVVDCFSGSMDWSEVWTHQLRWARTIRVCKPLPYAFSILNNQTLWPLLWFSLFPGITTGTFLAVCLLFRMFTAQRLQSRIGSVRGQNYYLWLAPVKDLTHFCIWAMALFGNHIVWRGQRYRLQRDGKLTPDC